MSTIPLLLDRQISLREAADAGYGSIYTLRRWIKNGSLPAVKIGQKYKVSKTDLESLRHPVDAPRAEPIDEIKAWAKRVAETAPPLTAEQAADIVAILRSGHRYATTWPSVVPDEAGNPLQYKWYTPEGYETPQPPSIDDLATLPTAWATHLQAGGSASAGGSTSVPPVTAPAAQSFEQSMEADTRPMASRVQHALDTSLAAFTDPDVGSHHDAMTQAVMRVIEECSRGNAGYVAAVKTLRETWDRHNGGSKGAEFTRMVTGAVAKTATERAGVYTPRVETPEDAYQHTHEIIYADLDKETQTKCDGSAVEVVRKSYQNTEMIFARDPILQHLGLNTMGGRLAWRQLPPWRNAEETLRAVDNRDIAEIDRVVCSYFGGGHNSLARESCDEARIRHAGAHPFSPWKDHIESLPPWDGIDRVHSALPDFVLQGGQTQYSGTVLMNFFLGIMQRVYIPGSKLDAVLVLSGRQEVYKTSWFRAIPPEDLAPFEAPVVPDAAHEKDTLISAHGSPILLFGEMDKLRKKDDQSSLKAFISGVQDMWCSPYARVDQTHRRQFVMGGTTNKEEFLLDITGNRRYWILSLTDKIPESYRSREWMDLLLAEARDRFRRGERIYLGADFEAQANQVRARHLDDPVRKAVYKWLDDPRDEQNSSNQVVNVNRVSVKMLLECMKRFSEVNPTHQQGKQTVEKITAAMDAHPDYHRLEGRPRIRNYGQARKAWGRVPAHQTPTAPPASP